MEEDNQKKMGMDDEIQKKVLKRYNKNQSFTHHF